MHEIKSQLVHLSSFDSLSLFDKFWRSNKKEELDKERDKYPTYKYYWEDIFGIENFIKVHVIYLNSKHCINCSVSHISWEARSR